MSTGSATEGKAGEWLTTMGRLSFSMLSLVAANAGLLVFYFVYELSLFQLVLVFWCECLWVGLFSALKLVTASLFGEPYENRWIGMSRGAALFTSILVIGFSSGIFFSLLALGLVGIIGVTEILPQSTAVDHGLELVRVGLGLSILFLMSHTISFVVNFLAFGEFKAARVTELVVLPFMRCLSLLVAMLLGCAVAVFVPRLASTTGFGAVVILMKLVFDLHLHLKERRAFDIMRRAAC